MSVISLQSENKAVRMEEEATEKKVEEVKKRNELLSKFIGYSDSVAFLEREARSRLNYKLPEEEAVFIHRDLNSKKASSSEGFSLGKLFDYRKVWRWLREF